MKRPGTPNSPELVVFDLDGTLIDGYAAIGDALAYAMERLGETPLPPERVRAMVGHGLDRLLEKAVGLERAAEGVRLFRERYPEVAVSHSHLLPGVADTVAALAAAGHPMAVASNKPARFSRMILEAKGLASALPRDRGARRRYARRSRTRPCCARIMESAGASAAQTVVVGDMEVDHEFARAAGCRVVLIPGGSRTGEELARLEPDGFLGSIAELPAWIASSRR